MQANIELSGLEVSLVNIINRETNPTKRKSRIRNKVREVAKKWIL